MVARSIVISNLNKSYPTLTGTKHVLKNINLEIPSNVSLGILGRNGAGKTTLLRIISGLEVPDSGYVDASDLRLSWPIGKGGMNAGMSGRDNVRFVCRLHGLAVPPIMEFVEDFAELGEYLDMPIKTYSSGMKARLAFAISMAVDYDCYLIDEGFNTGDANFARKTLSLFNARREHANMIVVSHNASIIRRFTDMAGVLDAGVLTIYEDPEEALAVYDGL